MGFGLTAELWYKDQGSSVHCKPRMTPLLANRAVNDPAPDLPVGERGIRLPGPAAAALFFLLLLATGCLHRHHHRRQAQAGALPKIVQNELGLASWYGHPYHGRPTASGEIYNMHDMTAAHRTLPFGTRVRVHDLDNGHDVEVRINDRGPFVNGRIIDLSNAAAKSIQMIGAGTAHVRLEILALPAPGTPGAVPGVFAVQIGSFRNQDNATRLKARLEQKQFNEVTIQTFDRGDGIFYRVRVGAESSQDDADALAERLRQANLAGETFVVRLN